MCGCMDVMVVVGDALNAMRRGDVFWWEKRMRGGRSS
jgi:hypothetical protein